MSRPALYSAAQADQIPWPDTPDGDYARRYLDPMLRAGTRVYIDNVVTRLFVLIWDELALPVTVNEAEYDNCYVVSPHNHYVTYAREELRVLDQPLARAALDASLVGLDLALRTGEINRTVHVNNWMLSTNLYLPLTRERLKAIRDLLLARFPDHAIVFRSINTVAGPGLLDDLKSLDFLPIASRQLYFMRPAEPAFFNTNMRKIWKKDQKLIDGGPYRVVSHEELRAEDLPRVLQTYNQLYLDKYSWHNPRFTPAFIEQAWRTRTLELRALRQRETGRIDGAIGFFLRNGHMTTPLFGYDITLPQELGLYRMLSLLTYREAAERQLTLNQSSGAGNFKRSRGGRANVEYSLVYERHLWPHRRLAWQGLAAAIENVAVPVLKQYKL